MCGYNGAKLQKKYEIANVLLVFLIIYISGYVRARFSSWYLTREKPSRYIERL